ncbi:ABC transporter ATP-binding protein [Zoogloea sp.]|uniref:ABC transporter ATP-binding protein n=1 Tax=Zoogloea sp. TaxID=49181 RepID=UPI002638F52A|nr:ABC transporter ATP-binding protein [Zoogloea sp.]MDD3352427.1 ABC transporter ATP-binding protein [Zoogloea sp.]
MTAVIELAGLRKAYNQGTPVETEVLHGIDLRLEEGEFAALIGPSGSGKSTLLNLIGLLERPTGGRLSVGGRDTARISEAELTALRGRSIGFVFQFHHLLPAFTALENVMMPTIIARGVADEEAEADALALLDAVGLKAHAYKKPAQLSGGQQQRVAIARALALRPRLILADEPTGNLDTHTADEIFALLRAFNRDSRCACLIVTHDPRLAARCDRIVRLVDGRIAEDRAVPSL